MKTRKTEPCIRCASGENSEYHQVVNARAAQHTPTPWSFELGSQPHTIAIVNDSEMKTVAVLHHDKKEDETNAAFIVKAVNSHEKMVALLGEIHYKHNNTVSNDLAIRIIEVLRETKAEAV